MARSPPGIALIQRFVIWHRFKPLIIVSAAASIVVYVLMLWTTSMGAMQVCQVFWGLFMATEVAYYT